MRVLIADDDLTSRHVLRAILEMNGHEVVETTDGNEAWTVISGPNPPRVIILDRVMPEMDGITLCRKIREIPTQDPPYIMILTIKDKIHDIAEGLDAGANDYLTKPIAPAELSARLRVGIRLLDIQHSLNERIRQLEETHHRLCSLEGIIPICTKCKKIRTDEQAWEQLEKYVEEHSAARFSHGICPDCLTKTHPSIHIKPRHGTSAQEHP
jgi:DNA-binding response OmpR family regulator